MLSDHESVHHLKRLVLLSQDARTAEDILLAILKYTIARCLKFPCAHDIKRELLIVVQALLEFDIPYDHFQSFLAPLSIEGDLEFQQFLLQHTNSDAMCIKPTHQAIGEILRWQNCRKDPLIPSRNELEKLVYHIVRTSPTIHAVYTFDEGKYIYVLYWQNAQWHLYDRKKSLTWHFSKKP